MADTPGADEVRKELEKQIAELKKEVTKLGKSLSARGEAIYEDLRDDAGDAYDAASKRARGAAKQVRQQAHAVSEVIRDNPGTAATVLSSAGLVGFLLGLVAGHLLLSANGNARRWY